MVSEITPPSPSSAPPPHAPSSLSLPGAVPPTAQLDSGVAWHYGNPFAEQRSLASGAALVDLSHLAVVVVSGVDRLSWLHDLTTANLRDLPAGESRLALILDHNGRIEHELHLVDDGERTFLVVESERAAALVSYLDSMRFLLRVEVADRSADIAVVGSAARPSPGATEVLGRWRVPAEFAGTGVTESGSSPGGDPARYVPNRPARFDVDEWLIARSDLMAVLQEAPALAGTWAREALRVAAGVPRVILDADTRALPHELGLIGPGVHLEKGCYRGQEAVARTHNMGRPPRRLVLLLFAGSGELPGTGSYPEPGSDVTLAGRRVGRLGSVVQHGELGPIGLALVKRSLDPNSEVDVAGEPASQVEVVAQQI